MNVHYDAVATVEVESESEEEALELAQNEASEVEIEDYFYKDACVTNVEEL